jgi:hypothetical protein
MLHSSQSAIQDLENLLNNSQELLISQILLMLTFTASLGLDIRRLRPNFESILQDRGYHDSDSWVSNVFKALSDLSNVRLDYYANSSDISLCKSIAESVLLEKDADDLVHLPYFGTMGTVLSGLNSFLGGMPSHYKPSNYSRVYFFVVGGITWSEINDIKSVAKSAPNSHVMIGSTNIISHDSLITHMFGALPKHL